MTMILALANRDNIIHLSDRRLTAQGTVIDEESGKSGVLFCKNGSFAFGFTGIARIGSFETNRWILDTLRESGPPDFMILNILERLKGKATEYFRTNKTIRCLPPKERRLTLMFTGYLLDHIPPMIGCSIISNYMNPSENLVTKYVWDEFVSSYTSEKKPRQNSVSYVQRVGAWRAMPRSAEISLRSLLEARKPAKAIIDKSISLMLKMADHIAASGSIGKQINWIRIPSKKPQEIETGYHSNIPTHSEFTPSVLFLTSAKNGSSIDHVSISAVGKTTTPPIAVQKVSRNAPCPCGSGKKYRFCHGKQRN